MFITRRSRPCVSKQREGWKKKKKNFVETKGAANAKPTCCCSAQKTRCPRIFSIYKEHGLSTWIRHLAPGSFMSILASQARRLHQQKLKRRNSTVKFTFFAVQPTCGVLGGPAAERGRGDARARLKSPTLHRYYDIQLSSIPGTKA